MGDAFLTQDSCPWCLCETVNAYGHKKDCPHYKINPGLNGSPSLVDLTGRRPSRDLKKEIE